MKYLSLFSIKLIVFALIFVNISKSGNVADIIIIFIFINLANTLKNDIISVQI